MLTFIDDENQRYFISSIVNDQWLVYCCPFNQALTSTTIYCIFTTHDDAVQWVREKILFERQRDA